MGAGHNTNMINPQLPGVMGNEQPLGQIQPTGKSSNNFKPMSVCGTLLAEMMSYLMSMYLSSAGCIECSSTVDEGIFHQETTQEQSICTCSSHELCTVASIQQTVSTFLSWLWYRYATYSNYGPTGNGNSGNSAAYTVSISAATAVESVIQCCKTNANLPKISSHPHTY